MVSKNYLRKLLLLCFSKYLRDEKKKERSHTYKGLKRRLNWYTLKKGEAALLPMHIPTCAGFS